jgi:cell volume regulation protein A
VLRKAPLPRRLSALLEAESGSNDPMAILLTVGLLATVEGSVTPAEWAVFGLRQLVGGAVVGVAVGYVGAVGLNRSHLGSAGLYSVLGLGVAGLAYGVGAGLGTSGFLAVYVAGIVVAARSPRHRRSLRTFHEGLAATAQIGLFLLLGLLVFPAQLPPVAVDATVIALVLVFVARPLAVLVCLLPFRMPSREVAFAGWAGLRGAVPIVLATFPLTAGYEDGVLIFDVIFFVVLVSAVLQGFTITPVAARLGLRAEPTPWADVAEVVPLDTVGVDLLEVEVPDGAAVAGGTLARFPLPGQARVSAIVRRDQVLVPDGGTVLEAGDLLMIVSGPKPGLRGALGRWLAGDRSEGDIAGTPPPPGTTDGALPPERSDPSPRSHDGAGGSSHLRPTAEDRDRSG